MSLPESLHKIISFDFQRYPSKFNFTAYIVPILFVLMRVCLVDPEFIYVFLDEIVTIDKKFLQTDED